MPYSDSDATRFTRKANTPRKKRQWRHVFDSAIKRGSSESSAIRQASGAVKRNDEGRTRMARGRGKKGRKKGRDKKRK